MNKRVIILVVDDEPPIRRLLKTILAVQGYEVIEAESGLDALAALEREKPDLIILDLGLPDISGLDVIRIVRVHSKVPLIVLSARDDERGKVETLDAGADDYVTKPFGVQELGARIRTALRHRFHEQGETPLFVSGELSVDLVRRSVRRRGEEVHLSPKEYDLLAEFVSNAGKVLTHREILTKVWGSDHSQDAQYLRVFVRNLRSKLELDPSRPQYILTEAGIGYRLRDATERGHDGTNNRRGER
jgi:two-component system, OmpR family, KDP operon response regulator KdpE